MRVALVFLLAASVAGNAQTMQMGRAATARDSVPATIEAAEVEGARFALPTAPDSSQMMLRTRPADGTFEHKCVAANGSLFARSGDFGVAGFAAYASLWHTGFGKLLWSPAHPTPASPARLVVRATRLDQPTTQWVFEQPFLAHGGSGSEFGYPSGFYLPSPGRWMLVARAGANWGCFLYTLA